ncbi:hypothetical protein PoB_007410100 [Plakobranchus ocellatus]|uniref:LITAF domain-containing protein n=1 Tax=Plakobranchus ocellatus TaxID=259542 RepID=A0AAV4DUT5_9GAST|nr:hypothetical protein PoB_007410100 [Plakobranchus ocellatus]
MPITTSKPPTITITETTTHVVREAFNGKFLQTIPLGDAQLIDWPVCEWPCRYCKRWETMPVPLVYYALAWYVSAVAGCCFPLPCFDAFPEFFFCPESRLIVELNWFALDGGSDQCPAKLAIHIRPAGENLKMGG